MIIILLEQNCIPQLTTYFVCCSGWSNEEHLAGVSPTLLNSHYWRQD